MAVEKLSLKIHIFFAILGLFAGVLGFMVFVFGFYNYHAGSWSLVAGFMAAFLLHIHHLKYRECLGAFYTKERLKFTGLLGLFMTLVSATAMICYFVFAHIHHIPMLPIQHSLILGGVQAFVTLKWSVSLVYFSHKHHKTIDQMRLLD